ncbi:MAG: hypothetical protein ABH803_04365 [Candidatus Micrarchaeota archaeon]
MLIELLVVFGFTAWLWDFYEQKIPNWLSALVFVNAFLLGFNVLSFFLALIFSLFLFRYRVWGGGDSKFFVSLSVLLSAFGFHWAWLQAFLLSALFLLVFLLLKTFNSAARVRNNNTAFAGFLSSAFIVIACLGVK